MPTRLGVPILTVDVAALQQIDTNDIGSLFSLWTVFNKHENSIEEGRRLENLSWRMWNRQAFCCGGIKKTELPTTMHQLRQRNSPDNMPRLSCSVDTALSDEYERPHKDSNVYNTVAIRGLSSTKNSVESLASSTLAPVRPISSQAFERMVYSIKETQIADKHNMTALPAAIRDAVPSILATPDLVSSDTSSPSASSDSSQGSTQESGPSAPPHSPPKHAVETRASHSSASTVPLISPESNVDRSQTFGSETSAEFMNNPDVVRGFTPTSISSYRNTSIPSPADPKPIKPSSLRPKPEHSALKGGKGARFQLGSGSSDEESSSVEEQMSLKFKSKLTDGLKQQSSLDTRKQTSFKEEVESRTITHKPNDSDVFEESDEDDDVSESAVEDEDSEWEEASDVGDENPVPEQPLFQRVDSKPNLVSRRSLLTTMMHQSERANAMAGLASKSQPALHRSRTTSPNGPSLAATPEEESFLDMQGTAITRSKPIIMTTSNTLHAALSPRTTRRNMLATELTESLRKHLLWERQQKNTTANAVLKRRHTSHDVANLQHYPDAEGSGATSKNNSWNHYFDHGLGEYHSKGW